MWKILIADDEPKIRRGLRGYIEKMEVGFQEIVEAEDGIMALEIAKELKPHIILVDINMPKLNGLGLIEKINEKCLNTIIIIITGYDDFSYTQKAIRLGVFDYLLKPVKKEEFFKVIENAIRKISENETHNWRQEAFDKNIDSIKENVLYDIISGKTPENEIIHSLKTLNFLSKQKYGMFAIKIMKNNYNQTMDIGSKFSSLLEEVQTLIENSLKSYEVSVVIRDELEHIIAICEVNSIVEWVGLSEKFASVARKKLNIEISVNQEILSEDMLDIKKTYEKLIEIMQSNENSIPIVAFVKNYIDNHYYEPDLTLKQVSKIVRVTPDYLSKLLKKDVGMAFIDYVTKIRVQKAICFMNDPSVKFYEIAEQVGYSNQHYFSTAFKKIMGVSPSAYKNGGKK